MSGHASSVPRNRAFAGERARNLLGVADLTTSTLYQVAVEALDPQRADKCFELAREFPLSRRSSATSAIAALILGVRTLGGGWWKVAHQSMVGPSHWTDAGTPDELLVTARSQDPTHHSASPLERLGYWIADDAADSRWGRPVDWVDLNDPRVDDRIVLPRHAREGDRLVVSFDPGSRVWADVVSVKRASSEPEAKGRRLGTLNSQLDSASIEHVDVAELDWAWGLATDVGPIRFPDEEAVGGIDPFAQSVDPEAANVMYGWAARHGADAQALGEPWRTKGDMWSARFRLGLPYERTGEWFDFDRCAGALLDDEAAELRERVARLKS